jgi:hypothetical protein
MRKKKDPAPPIPDVHWTDDMTWTLLSEVEKDSNRLVLLGKWEKKEVSTCSLPFRNHLATFCKSNRGVNHPQLARGLCPRKWLDEFDKDPDSKENDVSGHCECDECLISFP